MIRIRGLRKQLGGRYVLDGVDLDIPTGCTIVILGRSGTGKSVLLKHIIGLMQPDEGTIEVDGEVMTGLPERELNEVRKRVGLARAIAMDPAYILYDEPTTGLDPIMADVINRLIRSLQQRIGVTSIVVTHDLHSAMQVGDRLAMLHEGQVVFTGTPSEAHATNNLLVKQFIEGNSEAAAGAV